MGTLNVKRREKARKLLIFERCVESIKGISRPVPPYPLFHDDSKNFKVCFTRFGGVCAFVWTIDVRRSEQKSEGARRYRH